MKLVKGKIENWTVVEQRIPMSMVISAEKAIQVVVVGEIGFKFFKSSEIIKLTPTQVETKNSIYDLGTPRFTNEVIYNMGKYE